jgi:hypothetical protein
LADGQRRLAGLGAGLDIAAGRIPAASSSVHQPLKLKSISSFRCRRERPKVNSSAINKPTA